MTVNYGKKSAAQKNVWKSKRTRMTETILEIFDKDGESIASRVYGEIELYEDSYGFWWYRQGNTLINQDFVFKMNIEGEE